MPESEIHARLVKAIIEHLEVRLGMIDEIMVQDDSTQPLRGERPQKVNGFVPDVYATDVPMTRKVIGEAKTAKDLETVHSRQQITTFLEYLSHTPNSLFVLAVPSGLKARARWVIKELGKDLGDRMPETEIIDDTGIGVA